MQYRKIQFKSLTDNIDTTTIGGKLIFSIFAALAQFEKDLIRQRTRAGLKAARARGRLGGRPKSIPDSVTDIAKTLHADHTKSIASICKSLGISKSTFYRRVGK